MEYNIDSNCYDSSIHELCVFLKLNNLHYRHNVRLYLDDDLTKVLVENVAYLRIKVRLISAFDNQSENE